MFSSINNPLTHQAPTPTEWGEMAVIADPEGRKIELYKK
jgi:predicted enzyme related to lactoylglutathione lyase